MGPNKQTYFVLRDGTQFGVAETVEMTEAQALPFCRAGELALKTPDTPKPERGRAAKKAAKGGDDIKTLRTRVKQLEAELAAGSGAAVAAAVQAKDAELTVAAEAKAALEAELAEARTGLEQAAADYLAIDHARRICDRTLEIVAAGSAKAAEQVAAARTQAEQEVQPELVPAAEQG